MVVDIEAGVVLCSRSGVDDIFVSPGLFLFACNPLSALWL
jgi:hypothetical protein